MFESVRISQICHFVELLAYNSKNIKQIWILMFAFKIKGKTANNSIRGIPPTGVNSTGRPDSKLVGHGKQFSLFSL